MRLRNISPPFSTVIPQPGQTAFFLTVITSASDKTHRDQLNQSQVFKRRFYAWAPEDHGHVRVLEKAFQLSDRLTRWLRGDVGWTAGPKPSVNLHDFLVALSPDGVENH
ncbi:MAG: hypothetical protein QXK47_06380 [Candidatus Bathyarchaeia archaeon]